MPVLECCVGIPFFFVKIRLAVAEFTNVSATFAVLTIYSEDDAIFLSIEWKFFNLLKSFFHQDIQRLPILLTQ